MLQEYYNFENNTKEMTTFIEAKLMKSDGQANIDKYMQSDCKYDLLHH